MTFETWVLATNVFLKMSVLALILDTVATSELWKIVKFHSKLSP